MPVRALSTCLLGFLLCVSGAGVSCPSGPGVFCPGGPGVFCPGGPDVFCPSGAGASCPFPEDIYAVYAKADACFRSSHPTAGSDSTALALFERVIEEAGATHSADDILFQSYLNKGILLDIKGNFDAALDAYRGAMGCAGRHTDWSDTLRFRALVYAGTDYYRLDNFDSAVAVLGRAAAVDSRSPGLPERDRLYNALGALNYEGGNYIQGRDYFSRALGVVQTETPGDKVSIINFENNIASCLYKLNDYRGALRIYERLPRSGTLSSQLYLNIGQCYRGLGDYTHALALYRRVNPRDVPGVYNEIANAQFLKGDEDSALIFLDRWRFGVDGSRQTKVDEGVNALYRAQVLMARRQHIEALQYLQEAIMTFSRTFRDPDIHANPISFTGAFASYRLFDALYYKANTLEGLYSQTGNGEYLGEALNAYNSAILLFRYIEKTYATDDAKLFLEKNNRDLYENAVLVCLELDRLHPGGPYLEQAFLTAEKSKASIVSGRLEELALNHLPGIDPDLLRRQKDVLYNIARLDLKSDLENGSGTDQSIAGQKVDYEIELASLQRVMEQNSAYYNLKFEDSCPTVRELQAGLTDRQAIVSLFTSREGLHIFTLTSTSFHCLFVDSLASLDKEVGAYLGLLSNTTQGSRFGDKYITGRLYARVVKPLLNDLGARDEWTVIPDGIFYRLPFEALPLADQGHYLLERTTIGYQLSSKFLSPPFRKPRDKGDRYSVLSFAPFSEQGRLVQTPALRYMNRLAGSGPETAGLPGRRFVDVQATKARFLEELSHYRVIHLATHASVDSLGGHSICFYPRGQGPEDDCLFLPEIYALNMDATDLVILSACESGNGRIAENEGMISLSRGFMYAGCASTVNSLWKADDRSTAAILRQFHVYLEKGFTKSAALRQAKLDYIHSNALYVSPNYWAHLVLVGNTDAIVEKQEKRGEKSWAILFVIAGLLGAAIVSAILIWRARSANPKRLFA